MKRLRELWGTAVRHLSLPGLVFITLGLLLMAGGLVYHVHWLGMAAPPEGMEAWFAGYLEVADSIVAAGFVTFVIGALFAIVRLLRVTFAGDRG